MPRNDDAGHPIIGLHAGHSTSYSNGLLCYGFARRSSLNHSITLAHTRARMRWRRQRHVA